MTLANAFNPELGYGWAAMGPLVVSGMTRWQHHWHPVRRHPPQWSPLVVSGMTPERKVRDGSVRGPQWSPLVVSGMTCSPEGACPGS